MLPRKLTKPSLTKKKLIDNPNIQKDLSRPNDSQTTFDPNGYYSDRTDIMEIHRYVKKYLSNLPSDTGPSESRINQLSLSLNKKAMTRVETRSIERQIEQIEKEINEIRENSNKLNIFNQRVSPILVDWAKFNDGGPLHLGCEIPFNPDKLHLVRTYLQVCRDFDIPINMDPIPIKSQGLIVCPNCRQPFAEDDEQQICYDCGIYNDVIQSNGCYIDIGRINNGNINNYTEKETFDWAMICFQGKQPVNIPSTIRGKVNQYISDRKINPDDLKPIDMIAIFKDIGYPEYENVNLFLSMYNDWPLPDLSEYEDRLRQINQQFMQTYEEIKEDRTSAPNVYYRLYIYIRKEKIPVDITGLKMPTLRNTKTDLDYISRKVFEKNGWYFEDTA